MSAADLSETELAELACTYAALILHDDGIEVTADKITALLKAAKVDIQAFWPGLFVRVLAKKSIDDLIFSSGGGSGAAPAAAAAAPSGGAAPAAASSAPAAKKPEPEKEESDEEMGFGLFD